MDIQPIHLQTSIEYLILGSIIFRFLLFGAGVYLYYLAIKSLRLYIKKNS